ncbi:hypothetical protein DFH08DRAFT_77084 [Mycena albidolilacea]|uniref:Uncharacterized protein n=1 Tax=Mycena albidolilacea TaxID=1033008 RepID=A0AAD7A8A8_9AGAR|nr:hypothetical protein DFH08DRAFT_77084 [Mycena albidolilacea]
MPRAGNLHLCLKQRRQRVGRGARVRRVTIWGARFGVGGHDSSCDLGTTALAPSSARAPSTPSPSVSSSPGDAAQRLDSFLSTGSFHCRLLRRPSPRGPLTLERYPMARVTSFPILVIGAPSVIAGCSASGERRRDDSDSECSSCSQRTWSAAHHMYLPSLHVQRGFATARTRSLPAHTFYCRRCRRRSQGRRERRSSLRHLSLGCFLA